MKALVLGGCGFIGSHLVDILLVTGHKVRVFDRAPEAFRQPLANVDYRFGDFGNAPLLTEALEEIDVVYHLISTTVPSTSNLNPIADVQNNLINTLQMLQMMVQKCIPKIVFLSSGGTVYGISECAPIPETHPLHPICSYGVVKVAIENYLQMFHYLHGLEYVVLRASNPYGERQGHVGVQGVIGTFIGKILRGEQIEIWGDGSVVRDFIYVGDLVELCLRAGELKINGVFNAGSGKGNSLNEIIAALVAITNKQIEPIYLRGRNFDVPHVELDISKASRDYQWNPQTDLLQGVMRTWQWGMNLYDRPA